MHLKRFRGGSVHEALAAARADMGPSALVLSTRLVPATGLRGWLGERVVEVTAAVDRKVSATRQPAADEASANRASAPQPPAGAVAVGPATVRPADGVTAQLVATGMDRLLAAEVAGRVPKSRKGPSPAAVRRALEERLQWLAAADEHPALVQVFVGPPGAGKTTTIAKIAAQQRARRGAKLGLVAADGFRVGAVEQLRLYADIIGAPFRIARSVDELTTAVAESTGPILVDTAGRSPRDQEALELFSVFSAWPQVRTHLVVPGGTAPDAFERVLDAYAVARPSRVVFTKLDECDGLAPLIGAVRQRDLVVSYLTAGQRVPEDLECATAAGLAAQVLGETRAARQGEQA